MKGWERDFEESRALTVAEMSDAQLLEHGRRLLRLGVHRNSEVAHEAIGEAISRGLVPGVPARPRTVRITVVDLGPSMAKGGAA